MKKEPAITINGNKALIHFSAQPTQTLEIELIGGIGSTVVATPSRFGLQPMSKLKLPSGEEIDIPYVVGKITKITPHSDYRSNKWAVEYVFDAFVDMEDGTKVKFEGTANIPPSSLDDWLIFSHDSGIIPKISDYRTYTQYWQEYTAAYEEFKEEWEKRNPMKLK